MAGSIEAFKLFQSRGGRFPQDYTKTHNTAKDEGAGQTVEPTSDPVPASEDKTELKKSAPATLPGNIDGKGQN